MPPLTLQRAKRVSNESGELKAEASPMGLEPMKSRAGPNPQLLIPSNPLNLLGSGLNRVQCNGPAYRLDFARLVTRLVEEG